MGFSAYLVHPIQSDVALGPAVLSSLLDLILELPPLCGDTAQESSEMERP